MIEFLFQRWHFPPLETWLVYFPLGLLLGVASSWCAGSAKAKYQWKTGYTRKIFHFLIFTQAGIVGAIGGFSAVQVFGAAITLVVLEAVADSRKSRLFCALARPSDAPHEKFYILVPLLMTALGGMSSNLLFGQYALIGYITTGWGDAIAEPVGTRWGRHPYHVWTPTGIRAQRSYEGSAAVFVASLAGCLILMDCQFNLPMDRLLLTAIITSLTATLVEAVTFHSMDNLTIQISTSGVSFWMLEHWF